jgi:hypothetical protein
MNLYPYLSGAVNPDPLPFNFGGDGRYMYFLVCNGYTTASPTTQTVKVLDTDTDTVVETITLAANKDFASIFYRAVDQTVRVIGNNWVDIIDADPASVDFNTVITSEAWTLGAVTRTTGMYLPYPFDWLTSGGSQTKLNDGATPPAFTTRNGVFTDAQIRFGGHSNYPNTVYYHQSNLILTNRNYFKVLNAVSVNTPAFPYSFHGHTGGGVHNDLNAGYAYPIRFGNFHILATSGNVYLMSLETPISQILTQPFPTIAAVNRPIQEYCPNAPNRLFFTSQTTNNFLSVIQFSGTGITDLGDIDRAGYKDTNESGASDLFYNPYSGKLYCPSNNNLNLSGVSLVHIYDPTESSLGDMYQGSVSIGEFKSESRAAALGINTVCMNRTRIFEYQDVTI